MKLLQILKNKKGMTLIEIMVIAAIGFAVSLAMMEMISSSQKQQAHMERKFDFFDMMEELKLLYQNPLKCEESFKGIALVNLSDPNQVNNIDLTGLNLNGTPLKDYILNKVKISTIKYSVIDNSDPVGPLLKFFFQVDTASGEKILPTFREKALYVKATLDPVTQQITTCLVTGGEASGNLDLHNGLHSTKQCQALGGSSVVVEGVTTCRFSGGTCPNGWIQFKNWSATTSRFCGLNGRWANGRPQFCNTGGHAWGNTPGPETCTYTNSCVNFHRGMCISYSTSTCTAIANHIACY